MSLISLMIISVLYILSKVNFYLVLQQDAYQVLPKKQFDALYNTAQKVSSSTISYFDNFPIYKKKIFACRKKLLL